MRLCPVIAPIATSKVRLLRYLHLSQDLPMLLTWVLPSIIKTFWSTYRHTVSVPQCWAVLWFQWISLQILMATGECRSITGTLNVLVDKSFITEVAFPMMVTLPVGTNETLPSFNSLRYPWLVVTDQKIVVKTSWLWWIYEIPWTVCSESSPLEMCPETLWLFTKENPPLSLVRKTIISVIFWVWDFVYLFFAPIFGWGLTTPWCMKGSSLPDSGRCTRQGFGLIWELPGKFHDLIISLPTED